MIPHLDPITPLTPSQSDKEKAVSCIRTMNTSSGPLRLSLERPDHTVAEVELPTIAAVLLRSILSEVARGNAVTALPVTTELTTRQAADILNVSRPYLIGLLERGLIPHHRVGSHRRISLQDVLKYKAQGDLERDKTMDELVNLGQQFDSED